MRRLAIFGFGSLAAIAGCNTPAASTPDTGSPADSGGRDAGTPVDTGVTPDAFRADSSTPRDASAPDAFAADAFVADAFVADAFVADAFVAPDAFVPDAYTAVCGNSIVDTGEECDDGNTVDGDGCQSTCRLPACGDSIVDAGETCDDGNTVDGDGCSATCQTEPGCGDGIVQAGEACDDGNRVNGDGCNATCSLILYIDPVAGGHTSAFTAGDTRDDSFVDITLPFAFPYWNTATTTATTMTIGFGTNGGLRMDGGYTSCCSQDPLWNYGGGAPTIHAHGADGYVDTGSTMYSYADANMAVFTWVNMNYCCVDPGGWGVQVILYPNGNWTVHQITASSDTTRAIAVGFSDGSNGDNSVAGATGIDWNAQTIGAPLSVGAVDFGANGAGGLSTGRTLSFTYDAATGYTATVVE